jgi:hypothetical protein
MKKLLTIEYDSEDEILEMHLDKEGAKLLLNKIQMLLEKDENSHEHLMTDTWGGNELTSEKQNLLPNITLLNHLKIIYWKESYLEN